MKPREVTSLDKFAHSGSIRNEVNKTENKVDICCIILSHYLQVTADNNLNNNFSFGYKYILYFEVLNSVSIYKLREK